MTPEQLTAMTAFFTFLSQVGSTSALTVVVAVVLGPWAGLTAFALVFYGLVRRMETKYDNNVLLVETSQEQTANSQKQVEQMLKALSWNSAEVSDLKSAVENNLHCPIVRKNAKPKDIQYGG